MHNQPSPQQHEFWQASPANRRFLGILGGMGPLASAQFMYRLTLLSDQGTDQEHIPSILWSDPRVPDRTDARLHGGPDPLPALVAGINGLLAAGAKKIVIPCNSAHLWYDEIVQQTGADITHIVAATIERLHELNIKQAQIGIMGTNATLNFGLYQGFLERAGYRCRVLEPEQQDRLCMGSIRLIKANQLEAAYPLAEQALEHLYQAGAQAIVLGCTEFAIAVPDSLKQSYKVPIIDSVDALALAAIKWYYLQ